ncbi:MAG: hypothetical protein ACRD63_16600, partial [Pyrinomonadaceae bacterium]
LFPISFYPRQGSNRRRKTNRTTTRLGGSRKLHHLNSHVNYVYFSIKSKNQNNPIVLRKLPKKYVKPRTGTQKIQNKIRFFTKKSID